MTPYIVGWSAFTVLAAFVAWRYVRLDWRAALSFLLVPWKVAVFVPAILFVTFAGRFTDDETWDVVSGGGMSILTVLTAWWSVGTAVRVVRRMAHPRELVVAVAATLFSASWFYDGYLFLRDGAYTQRWLGNLMLSPTIYLCAGLLSNLEIDEQRRLGFSFLRADWPRPLASARRISLTMVLVSIPLVVIAAWFLVGFVGWHV